MIKDISAFLLLFACLYGAIDYGFMIAERYNKMTWDDFFKVKTWFDTIISSITVATPVALIFVFFMLKMKLI